MAKTQTKRHHQAAAVTARAAGMVRGAPTRFYDTGVSRNAVRAGAAADEIAEALAERAERKTADK
jgi:hypothetical protein